MDDALVKEAVEGIRKAGAAWDGHRFGAKAWEELKILQRAAGLARQNPHGHWLEWQMQIDGTHVIAHPHFMPALHGEAGWVGPVGVESVDLGELSEPVIPFVDFDDLLRESCVVSDIKLGFESEVKAWREKLRDRLLELVPKN